MATKSKTDMPSFIPPMLAEGVTELPPVDKDDKIVWGYERKIDGHRMQLHKVGDRIRIRTRNDRQPQIDVSGISVQAKRIDAQEAILDGEVVAVDKKGIPNWEALQHRDPKFPLAFFAFDCLYCDGQRLMQRPLWKRQEILASIIENTDLQLCIPERGNLATITRRLKRQGYEGVVAKDPESLYQPGRRTYDWQKKAFVIRQEFVIGGFRPIGNDSLDSLLVGVYEGSGLTFSSQVRAGLDRTTKGPLRQGLQLLAVSLCPFVDLPTSTRRSRSGWGSGGVSAEEMGEMQWVRPHVLAVVEFRHWTSNKRLRHPTFVGVRIDKPASEVVRET